MLHRITRSHCWRTSDRGARGGFAASGAMARDMVNRQTQGGKNGKRQENKKSRPRMANGLAEASPLQRFIRSPHLSFPPLMMGGVVAVRRVNWVVRGAGWRWRVRVRRWMVTARLVRTWMVGKGPAIQFRRQVRRTGL